MNMTNDEALEKILNLQADSRMADERLEIQLQNMNKRLEAVENLSQVMAENISDMKHLQSIVDTLSDDIHKNTEAIKDLKTKYYELESKPMKEKANKWQYITDSIFKTIIGIVLGFVLVKIGLK